MNNAFKLFHWLFLAVCPKGVGNGESEIDFASIRIGITIVQVINRSITSFHSLTLKSTTAKIIPYYKNVAFKKKLRIC